MHHLLTQLNGLVLFMNNVNPYWYVVLIAPLTTIAMHLMKAERDFEASAFVKKHGLAVHLGLSFIAGGFLAVFKASGFDNTAQLTAVVGAPIYLIGNVLYQTVGQKIEAYRVGQVVAPSEVSAPAVAGEQTVSV